MKNILIILTLLSVISCNEFTEKNLTTAPKVDKNENGVEQLLSQTNRINTKKFSVKKLIANIKIFIISPQIEKLNEDILNLNSNMSQYYSALKTYDTLTINQLNILRKPLQNN